MAHPLRGRTLDRRTVLRGLGATIALPYLDAMQPLRRSDAPRCPRALFVFQPNGVVMSEWRPSGEGSEFEWSSSLSPLVPLRSQTTVLSGLTLDGGRSHGDGTGDHARSAGSFLTTAHPKKTGGRDIRAGRSIDQAIAEHIESLEDRPPFHSLELGMESGGHTGVCDSGYSCAYTTSISWKRADQPLAKETNPRVLFERLFGDAEARAASEKKRRRDRALLDSVLADARALRRRLSPADRDKLEEYLASIHELETRMDTLEQESDEALADVPVDLLDRDRDPGFRGRLRLMYELIALAFHTDRTRVASFMLGNAGSERSYRFLGGLGAGHHSLSHHREDARKLDTLARINRFHVEEFSRFAQRLSELEDGDRSLLDRSTLVYGSGLSDGNRHNHEDLPFFVVGSGDRFFRAAGHLVTPRNTPAARLYASVGQSFGMDLPSFGDGDRALTEIHAQ